MTYKLTEEQLRALLEDAVKTALEKVVEIAEPVDVPHKDAGAPVTSGVGIKVTEFSKEQYAEAMATMAANRGQDEQPKVGLFWYNRAKKELFGVVARKTSDFTKANARGGLVTCTEMHEDIWKKGFRKQKYQGDGTGPYIGAYENKPRGRIFYSPAADEYIIAVGRWINENPEAVSLIMEEFNLPSDKTVVQIADHWDIGQKWM